MREIDGKSCSCGWRAGKAAKPVADTSCTWRDATGDRCGRPGSICETAGWLCPDHYGLSKGLSVRPRSKPTNWRERWYAERGLPYEPPKLGDFPPFRSVGRLIPAVRQREPGEDDQEVAA